MTESKRPRKKRIYRVIFINQGKVYQLHARAVSQPALYGFLEVGDFVFGESGGVVIDPSEERLKSEFESVKSTWIPLHAVIRVDEVEKEGANKISALSGDSNVATFPSPIYTPRGD